MPQTTYETLVVLWLSSVANQNAPTVAEIAAGINLSSQIPVNGVNRGGSANNAGEAALGDAFVGEEPGTWGRTLEITFFKDRAASAWGLYDYRTEGFFVFSDDGAPIATDQVEVWHVKSHERQSQQSAENEKQKFSVQFAVLEAPKLEAVVT